MICTIEWNGLDRIGWERKFLTLRRSTLLQSYDYARAVAPLYGQRPRWGLIFIDGREAGLVQILEAGFLGLHAFTLDRGPLWFDGFGGVAHLKAFFDALNRIFPARFGRKRRIIPEIPDSPAASGILKQCGLRYHGPKYTTAWLDLTQDPESLRAGMKNNWRSHLNKVEQNALVLDWSEPLQSLPFLAEAYRLDRVERGYGGPDAKMVRALGQQAGQSGNLLIGRALLNGRDVAAIMILCHGRSATYQIGWGDEDGRKYGGHYRLLWAALGVMKEKGIRDFDLGGINDDQAAGVSAFKDGLGGQRVTLAGLYT